MKKKKNLNSKNLILIDIRISFTESNINSK